MHLAKHPVVSGWDLTSTPFVSCYKASFRFSELDVDLVSKKVNFEGKKALLPISVGQAYHETAKFLATVELINKQAFASCDIVLGDTLQRHNHCARLGEAQAFEFARQEGDIWLERNAHALSRHQLPHRIIRWDELLRHNDYISLKEQVLDAYDSDPCYKDALHTNVFTYIERLSLINPHTDKNTLFQHGLNYLLEECPIVMPLWAQMGYDFIIYPKPLTPGMKKTRELFIREPHTNKCQWVHLRFKKKSIFV